MRKVYPVIIKPVGKWYAIHVPDFDCDTQGEDLADAIYMARDIIGLTAITWEDMGKELPKPHSISYDVEDGDIETLVDINLTEYRKQVDNKAVRKNCTIPYQLNVRAEKASINFSQVLTEALERELA